MLGVGFGRRRRVFLGLLLACAWTATLCHFLPYDNAFRSFVRFTTHKAFWFVLAPYNDESWLLEPPLFPTKFDTDIALIIKTGYGTQERVFAQLEALGLKADGTDNDRFLVVADFAAHHRQDGRDFEIHDMLAAAVAHNAIAGQGAADRVKKYTDLNAVIKEGKTEKAKKFAKEIGWELDAMKFIPAMELAYQKLAGKKWYMMVDDDTYTVRPSLEAILGHSDPSKPTYLGNAVGDYKGRFAHGGSSFLVSRAAMERLFDGRNTKVIEDAYIKSLTETWGDKLMATTLMKVGVYLDERYNHYFNGERPTITKIAVDRFCSPLVSFHGLTDPAAMRETGRIFRDITAPVYWSQLWKIYGQESLEQWEKTPARPGEDHVGRTDEHTITKQVKSVEDCAAICQGHGRKCLAWTHDKGKQECSISPWVIIGDRAEGKASGLNLPEVRRLVAKCGSGKAARGVNA